MSVNLGWRSLVGLFSGFKRSDADGGQLGLEHRHASAGGRQQLERGLQRRTQTGLSLHRPAEHLRQTRQQILDQLQRDEAHVTRFTPSHHVWFKPRAHSLTSLHSFRLTNRLSGVGKNTSEGGEDESSLISDTSLNIYCVRC